MPPALPFDQLALAAVQPRANVEVELADGLPDRAGTADRPCRAVEGGGRSRRRGCPSHCHPLLEG